MILQFNLLLQNPFSILLCNSFVCLSFFIYRTIILYLQRETKNSFTANKCCSLPKHTRHGEQFAWQFIPFSTPQINEDTQVLPFIPSHLISSLFFSSLSTWRQVVQFNGTNPVPCCKAKVSHQTTATSSEMLVVRTYLVTFQHCSSKSSNRCGLFSLPPYIVFFSLMICS